MKSLILASALFSGAVSAQCFGPVCVNPEQPIQPVGPSEVCVEVCTPVAYSWVGTIAVAETTLPNGYQVVGWSGPCINDQCPDILNQAHADLRMNTLRITRAQRY